MSFIFGLFWNDKFCYSYMDGCLNDLEKTNHENNDGIVPAISI